MERAEKIILEIKGFIEGSRVMAFAEQIAGPYMVAAINERVTKGVYLGGSRQNLGYSTTPIPTWFLGGLLRELGDKGTKRAYKLNAQEKFNKTITIPQNDIFWSSTSSGRSTAFLKGGYKHFRKLAGRRDDLVDLTFTGSMLASLRHDVTQQAGVVQVTVKVSSMNAAKAYYTDRSREWMNLSDKELNFIESRLSDLLK